uniref:LAGLIDADG_2 domain-containing protein n=1 Tax=Parastrongyloides trichosuri TaxID=131310 RepID=A0A0N4ZM13_PARTI
MRRPSRDRINIPYYINGTTLCNGSPTSEVLIKLMIKGSWKYRHGLSKTRPNSEGNFSLTAQVPHYEQRKLILKFWHKCNMTSKDYRIFYYKTYSLNLTDGSKWFKGRINYLLGEIELSNKANGNKHVPYLLTI